MGFGWIPAAAQAHRRRQNRLAKEREDTEEKKQEDLRKVSIPSTISASEARRKMEANRRMLERVTIDRNEVILETNKNIERALDKGESSAFVAIDSDLKHSVTQETIDYFTEYYENLGYKVSTAFPRYDYIKLSF